MADKAQNPPAEMEPTLDGRIAGTPPAVTRLILKMSGRAELEADSPGIGDDQLAAILNAENEAAMWDADERGPLGGRDLAGMHMEIHDLSVKFSRGNTNASGEEIRSRFVDSQGRKMYVLVDAVRCDDTPGLYPKIRLPEVGTMFQWNTSAPFLVAKLFWLEEHSRFPGARVVIQATDIGGGQTVLKLKPLDKVPA